MTPRKRSRRTMPCTGVAVASGFEMETLLPPPGDGGRSPTDHMKQLLCTFVVFASVMCLGCNDSTDVSNASADTNPTSPLPEILTHHRVNRS